MVSLENTELSNIKNDYVLCSLEKTVNAISLDGKVYFLQVFENKDGHKKNSYAYNLRLNTFDLESKKLQGHAEEIELNFDKFIDGIKLVFPQSAPFKLSKIFAHVYF